MSWRQRQRGRSQSPVADLHHDETFSRTTNRFTQRYKYDYDEQAAKAELQSESLRFASPEPGLEGYFTDYNNSEIEEMDETENCIRLLSPEYNDSMEREEVMRWAKSPNFELEARDITEDLEALQDDIFKVPQHQHSPAFVSCENNVLQISSTTTPQQDDPSLICQSLQDNTLHTSSREYHIPEKLLVPLPAVTSKLLKLTSSIPLAVIPDLVSEESEGPSDPTMEEHNNFLIPRQYGDNILTNSMRKTGLVDSESESGGSDDEYGLYDEPAEEDIRRWNLEEDRDERISHWIEGAQGVSPQLQYQTRNDFNYKQPKRVLSFKELRSLALFDTFVEYSVTRDTHKAYIDIMNASESGRDRKAWDSRTTQNFINNLINMEPEVYDCCIESCMCYMSKYASLQACIICQKLHHVKGKSLSSFTYIPFIPHLKLQYSDALRVKTLMTYCEAVIKKGKEDDTFYDWWNRQLYKTLKEQRGLFSEKNDLGFLFSTNSVRLFKSWTTFESWPLMLINFNLPPDERYKIENILLCGYIPSPKAPTLIDSFFEPLVQEFETLQQGITAWNALTQSDFTL